MNPLPLIKIFVSSGIIASASELAKKSPFLGAILLALPFTSILSIVWMHYEAVDKQKIAELSWSIFWLVPPSLSFFPIFAILLTKNTNFWLAFAVAACISFIVYLVYSKILALFGISI
ncbi:MAG: DUF3147 family protein [Proteobacteria bacterium]|nr:DUF3147 family protein [Pseudomonadota bacterium]